ncbi:MerR family transcriptional regulator [Adlercreutzia sp. ZJ473]|uniref:MerR family transcriptional regulator n=1 Tax=Adlercreutzia sp. ZJ473 TaxID=2722822 RepID=UPI001554E9B6|nr:MerR family transcriptional regulator [Adlercreutzia sp. ZJ473]
MEGDLFKIGEIARLFHLSVSTLRHYDKLGLVSPEAVDPATGYRYYSTRQFERLNTIRYLRELDIPLERIQGFIENRGIEGVREMLLQQRADVAQRQERLGAIQRKIDNRLAQIDEAVGAQMDAIVLERVPARRIALLKKSFAVESALDLEIHIRELERNEESTAIFLGKVGIGLSQESLERGRFHPYELIFIVLDEEDDYRGGTVLLPEETCLVTRFRGSHEAAPQRYERLLGFARERGLGVAGFSREVTMIDFGLTNDVSEFVTEIQIPVTPLSSSSPDVP